MGIWGRGIDKGNLKITLVKTLLSNPTETEYKIQTHYSIISFLDSCILFFLFRNNNNNNVYF